MDRLVAAAARVFDQRGYAGATTNRVAEAAGVSIGSLYQYFESKDDLLVALAERHVAESLPVVRTQLAALRSVQRPLEATLLTLLELALALNDSTRLHAVIYAEAQRTPALRAALAVLEDELVQFLAAELRRHEVGGADAVRRARLLVAAADAAIHVVVLPSPPEERAEAVADLAAIMMHGVVSRRRG